MSRTEQSKSWSKIDVALVFAGVATRLLVYAHNRSLWLDEASLACNVISRNYEMLTLPLDDNQAAPVGFLMVVKSITHVLGDSEYALRLFPLLCGLFAMIGFVGIAKRLPSTTATQIAIGLFAFCPTLIVYSSEFKQYSTDVLVAVVIARLAIRVYQNEYRMRDLFLLGTIGGISTIFAHTSVFILTGVSLVLTLQSRSGARILQVSLCVAIWLALFACVYFMHLRGASDNRFLFEFWRESFVPWPPYRIGDAKWFPRIFLAFFDNPAGFVLDDISLAPLAAIVFAIGMISLYKRDPQLLAICLAPWGMVLIAAAIHKYPFGDRLVLFLVPSAILVVGEGSSAIMIAAKQFRLLYIIPAVLVMSPALTALLYAGTGIPKDNPRDAVRWLADHHKDGDTIHIYPLAEPAFRYYSRNRVWKGDYIVGSHSGKWIERVDGYNTLRGRQRVWLFFSHIRGPVWPQLYSMILDKCNSMGVKTESQVFQYSSVYLYDFKTDELK